MKFIIVICLFAFVATVASKITVWKFECAAFQLNAAAKKSPKLAPFYTTAEKAFTTIASEARECNAINHYYNERRCQQDLEFLAEKLNEEVNQLVDAKVSNVEGKFPVQTLDWQISHFFGSWTDLEPTNSGRPWMRCMTSACLQ